MRVNLEEFRKEIMEILKEYPDLKKYNFEMVVETDLLDKIKFIFRQEKIKGTWTYVIRKKLAISSISYERYNLDEIFNLRTIYVETTITIKDKSTRKVVLTKTFDVLTKYGETAIKESKEKKKRVSEIKQELSKTGTVKQEKKPVKKKKSGAKLKEELIELLVSKNWELDSRGKHLLYKKVFAGKERRFQLKQKTWRFETAIRIYKISDIVNAMKNNNIKGYEDVNIVNLYEYKDKLEEKSIKVIPTGQIREWYKIAGNYYTQTKIDDNVIHDGFTFITLSRL